MLKCCGTLNQEKKSHVTMEMVFLGRTMNFVNAIHANGRCDNDGTNEMSKCILTVMSTLCFQCGLMWDLCR